MEMNILVRIRIHRDSVSVSFQKQVEFGVLKEEFSRPGDDFIARAVQNANMVHIVQIDGAKRNIEDMNDFVVSHGMDVNLSAETTVRFSGVQVDTIPSSSQSQRLDLHISTSESDVVNPSSSGNGVDFHFRLRV